MSDLWDKHPRSVSVDVTTGVWRVAVSNSDVYRLITPLHIMRKASVRQESPVNALAVMVGEAHRSILSQIEQAA